MSKLFEWALHCDLDEAQRAKWEANLADTFPWDADVAARLVSSDWTPSPTAIEWIRQLAQSGRLAGKVLSERLTRRPDEFQSWFDRLPEEDCAAVLARRFPKIHQVVAFLESQGTPALWRSALAARAVAIDLETDGNSIWEVGVANATRPHLLLARDDPADGACQ